MFSKNLLALGTTWPLPWFLAWNQARPGSHMRLGHSSPARHTLLPLQLVWSSSRCTSPVSGGPSWGSC